MSSEEKLELRALPKKFKPLPAIAYIFYSVLFGLPIIGEVVMIIATFSAKNINLRRFAKAYFIILISAVVLVVLLALLGLVSIPAILAEYEKLVPAIESGEEKLAAFTAMFC